jgi:hypothetical protein
MGELRVSPKLFVALMNGCSRRTIRMTKTDTREMTADLNRASRTPTLVAHPPGVPMVHDFLSLKDALISAASYVVLASMLQFGLAAYRIGGLRLLYDNVAIPETLGIISAQFTLLAICLYVLAYLRKRSNVHKFILLDWRWWMFALVFLVHPVKPFINWLGSGLIYQYRESRNVSNSKTKA